MNGVPFSVHLISTYLYLYIYSVSVESSTQLGSCFLIYSENFYFLIGLFALLTLNIILNMVEFRKTILLFSVFVFFVVCFLPSFEFFDYFLEVHLWAYKVYLCIFSGYG